MQPHNCISQSRNRLLPAIFFGAGLLFSTHAYSQTTVTESGGFTSGHGVVSSGTSQLSDASTANVEFPHGITVDAGNATQQVLLLQGTNTTGPAGTTTSVYGLHELMTFDPGGAREPKFVFGGFIDSTLDSSTTAGVPEVSYVGLNVGLTIGPDFVGTPTQSMTPMAGYFENVLGIEVGDITNNKVGFTGTTHFYQYIALVTTNGDGDVGTYGNIDNRNFDAEGSTASGAAGSSSGGAVYNTNFYADLSSGSGTGNTSNIGLRIHGDGGTLNGTTENYAIYSDSAAPSVFFGAVTLAKTTVNGLPACTSASTSKGKLFEVTDASSPSWHATLVGGGSTFSGAMCNGSSWIAF